MDDDLDEDDDSEDSLLAAVARIPVVTTTEWTPPTELDEYKLVQPLGKGGMGSVWLAQDRLLDRLVAIKFISSEPDRSMRDRFAVEARAAARLQHPNVVSVYRYGEVAGRPYLVAEYIRGDSLDKLAKPVAWERVLELGIALSRGLAAAHRVGIVHRDIKPANAILSIDGDAKLVDFGLARLDSRTEHRPSQPAVELASGSTDGLTAPGAIAGTPRYLSPEVRRGEVAGRRSDIYGIGCVLYELLIGRAPILDLAGGTTVEGVPGASPLQARSLTGRVEPAGAKLAAVVDRCLREDAEERYGSGDELREALEQVAAPIDSRVEVPEGNPYRGLVAFDAAHRALFFGRGAEIRAVVERLRGESFVLVAGDSGAGKSSLCKAGVLPAIEDGTLDGAQWSVVSLVPHHKPLTTLAGLLAPIAKLDEAALATMMRDEPSQLARELRRTGTPVVVFVDQLEELCTVSDPDEVAAFGAVLAELITSGPKLRVLATVRSDFLTRVAELPRIGSEIARAIYLLRPLSAEGAREAIVGPARAKGARFESDELVETLVGALVGSGSGHRQIELPLLAFTLAQLWDARDPKTQTISAASLDAIGGVRGALARHADRVLEQLLPEQREVARKLLLRLVTAERTRARRSAAELAAFDRSVLDALVRSRLVVVRGDDPPTFELAHERLIDGWPTLAAWASNTAEAIAAHGRLATAVADWERLGRTRDGLWGARQLADLELLESEDLTRVEAEFAQASRRTESRRRWLRRGIAIAIPLVAAGVYVGARVIARRDLDRHITDYVVAADASLATARQAAGTAATEQREAFALFDKPDLVRAEPRWDQVRQHRADAATAYAQAARSLEAAFLLDTGRDSVRRRLAEVTLERAELADREYRIADRDDLLSRLALYDDGELARRHTAPARIVNAVTPASAIEIRSAAAATFETPVSTIAGGATGELPPGSYIAVAHEPGRATVRQAFVVAAADTVQLDFTLPAATAVPAGFVYVPPGSVLFGSRDEEWLRHFYDAQPMHPRAVGAFLIGRTEVTFAQWIEFLDAQSKEDRAKHTPNVQKSTDIPGELELRPVDTTWELRFTPGGKSFTARAGSPIVYPDRITRQRQDWLKFPVAGVSGDDAKAYAHWLDQTGKLPHARLCTEIEWERASRGADGRSYPRGETLRPEDANVDLTYGRKDGGMGPDEVGSHPGSDGVFGLADTSGNVWELVTAVDGAIVGKGSVYFVNSIAAHLANRAAVPPSFRHPHFGLRLCADP